MQLLLPVKRTNQFGKFEDRELRRVADVDRSLIIGLREPVDAFDEISDVTETAGLRAVAEHRQWCAFQRLTDECGHNTSIAQPHPRPVCVEDAGDLGVELVNAVVGHGDGLGEPLGFVVHAARADGIDVAPVGLGLRMLKRVAVHLRGRGEQKCRALFLGKTEGVVSAEGADLEGLDWQLQVIDRAGWRGKMENVAHRSSEEM